MPAMPGEAHDSWSHVGRDSKRNRQNRAGTLKAQEYYALSFKLTCASTRYTLEFPPDKSSYEDCVEFSIP